MARTVVALALFASTLAACAAEEPAKPDTQAAASPPSASVARAPSAQAPVAEASAARAKAPLAEKKFGAPITETTETALGDIVKSPASFADKPVRTSGVVQAVCQAAGCWMEIGDGSERTHVKMAGHAFVVPKHASGHRAVVQGNVKGGEAANECAHKDGCGGAEKGALAKLEIVATGVEFLD
jgi:hypothetical protein